MSATMSDRSVLGSLREWFADDGHWCQGRFFEGADGVGIDSLREAGDAERCCLMGGLIRTCWGESADLAEISGVVSDRHPLLLLAIQHAIDEIFNVEICRCGVDSGRHGALSIPGFNDSPNTDAALVRRVLARAEELLAEHLAALGWKMGILLGCGLKAGDWLSVKHCGRAMGSSLLVQLSVSNRSALGTPLAEVEVG
jgi:hypothetical protein